MSGILKYLMTVQQGKTAKEWYPVLLVLPARWPLTLLPSLHPSSTLSVKTPGKSRKKCPPPPHLFPLAAGGAQMHLLRALGLHSCPEVAQEPSSGPAAGRRQTGLQGELRV